MTPTANLGYQSFFQAQLTAGISASDLTIPLDVVPTPSEGFLVIESTSASKREIIYYTSKTVNSVVCPAGGRGYDGTTAQTHVQNSAVIMAPVAAMFSSMRNLFETTPQGWTPVTQTVSSVSYSGNRSYSLTMSADVSATLSNGMRVRTTRTVAAPTQCTSLNGTTQYWNDTSLTGMTFTNNFTCSAWIKLNSYQAGVVLTRADAALNNGYRLAINSSGQVELLGINTANANNRSFTSFQSVPLNKWVHVAVSWATGVGLIYIDGVSVPLATVTAGTAPTTITQAGDFAIGRNAMAASLFFNGKIAQAAVFSAVLSEATIRSYISQGLSGTETNLVSAYSFNGNANDLNTTNANNLTAQASATATNADSPFAEDASSTPTGTTDFGIVTNVATTTLTVQVPEGCAIPTSGGVSAISYSTQKAPYGMPIQRNRWLVSSIYRTVGQQSSPVSGTWYNLNSSKLNIPTGNWVVSYHAVVSATTGTSGSAVSPWTTLSTANNSESNNLFTIRSYVIASNTTSGTGPFLTLHKLDEDLDLTSATDYFLNNRVDIANQTFLETYGNSSPTRIYAVPSYL